MSIHYDGSQPLFTVDPSYGTTLYIGTTAFIDKNGLGVFDRDQSGQLVATHNATSFSAWGIAKPYKIYQPSFDVTSSGTYNYTEWAPGSLGQTNNPDNYYVLSYTSLNFARPDGFSIAATGAGTVLGELTFQGVRAYDSTTSQWSSSDFYPGDLNVPGSQRPFTWEGNNPFEYSDPSGYFNVVCAGVRGKENNPRCSAAKDSVKKAKTYQAVSGAWYIFWRTTIAVISHLRGPDSVTVSASFVDGPNGGQLAISNGRCGDLSVSMGPAFGFPRGFGFSATTDWNGSGDSSPSNASVGGSVFLGVGAAVAHDNHGTKTYSLGLGTPGVGAGAVGLIGSVKGPLHWGASCPTR